MALPQPESTEEIPFQITSTFRYDPDLPSLPHESTYPQPHSSPYYLLRYHHERLLHAAQDVRWEKATARLQRHSDPESNIATFSAILDAHIPNPACAWRLRVLLDHDGRFTVETMPTTPLSQHILLIPAPDTRPTFSSLLASSASTSEDPWTLRLDTQPTAPSAFTKHKTTHREMYTAARERVGIRSMQETAEALVYNPQGDVMDGSITSVYFRRRPQQQEQQQDAGGEEEEVWITPPLSSGCNAGTSRRYALATGLCVERVLRVEELIDGEEVWLSNGLRGFIRAVLRLN